ncbi:MAG: nucleotide exchange factor GrpE [Alcanivoracaceae bacterium]|uniref:nucleotide exchange factor GrpE n=1 Tax=Alcanivorax sp. MD8A TaxID=1177157 RepID=UPI000C65CCFB|nr:nucleotide exchange factor GrpE [Alcanivorax sp. MD8A]MAX54892.1 nucleotide exchange factor GrpE [Alcanivoracaceae bacterium]MCG8437523.1 nucleotide exchange factor GrpE [Pseudomonadales bacterium]MED5430936.1 nucleotide exchange factor GrpE [Pseudomonadota bacterium]MEE2869768.1 nucleotide exchange factor GrpE [Pseudomonadota bacterium]PNE03649.1 heat shock protein GrpE [Alcanivorax sp. MD8A]|tara:strand:- start:977 stop:1552 length:576 start_codon:yes stop_codon:yes gene_type:complete
MSEQEKDQKAAEPQVETVEEQQAAQAEAEAAEPTAEEALAEMEAELAKVKKALGEADVRAQAEVQNVRKRAERDVQHAHKFALEKFAGDLLSVADNLERGLAALDAQDEALKPAREGIELTLKSLLDVFGKYNLEQISPSDEPFNPELHEAMTMVPVPNVDPNTVIEVLEKGYQLNGRLIRPARVVVSKAP